MIEYDYRIERDEGEEEPRIYTPGPIPSELENLVEIEGPNSSGKSTLLNIIALAFYALDNDAVENPLDEEIKSLYASSHQDISFEIMVETDEIKLSSEKGLESEDITVRDKNEEKILTPETFSEQYNLIYDIPDDPLNRIEKIARNVEKMQLSYASDVEALRKKVNKDIGDINNRKSPKRLETAKKKLQEAKKGKNREETQLGNLETQYELLRKYVYSKYYKKFKEEYDNKKREYQELKEELEDIDEDDESEEDSNRLEDLHSDLEELRDMRSGTVELLETVFSDEDEDINVWKNLDLEPKKETNFRFPEHLDKEIRTLEDKLNTREEEIKEKEAYNQADFYKKMARLLRDYKNKGVKLPGNVSIDDFLDKLKKEQNKYDRLLKEKNRCNQLIDDLEAVRDKVADIRKDHLEELREMAESGLAPSVEESQRQRLETVKNTLGEKESKFKDYEEKYEEIGEPSLEDVKQEASSYVNKWEKSTREELEEKIENLSGQIESKKSSISSHKSDIDKYSQMKEELENAEPHKYEEYQDELNELHETLQDLDKKLRKKFDNFIGEIITGELSKDKPTDLQLKYNEALFGYLGDRMDTIRHDDTDYEVKEVNLIEKTIYTEEGVEIQFKDMGTGQSQSAYLKSLLNTEDDRKIIALFDEVAMMDSKSLEPVYDKLRELKEEGKLIIGIVVQHADEEVEVKSIG